MDAATNFAGCKEAGDRVAVGVDDFCRRVNMDTAHSVMDSGSDLDRVVRSSAQIIVHTGRTSEISVILIRDILVPGTQRLCEGRRIYVDL